METKVADFISRIQQTTSEPEKQELLDAIASELLKGRRVCRSRGQSLFGIYLETYQALYQQIREEVGDRIERYDPKQMSVREWTIYLRDAATRKVLGEDERLKKMALEAQQHPSGSEFRSYALRELVEAIRCSGRLCHPQRGRIPASMYSSLYADAVNRTLVYVCQKIDNYDPDRGKNKKFMNWVNFRLEKIAIELRIEANDPHIRKLDSLEKIEDFSYEKQESPLEKVMKFVEEDANGIFRSKHIRDRPDANFREIFLCRARGESWDEISNKLKIPIPTASSFFQRSFKNLAAKIKENVEM